MKRILPAILMLFLLHLAYGQLPLRLMSYNMRYDNPDDADKRWEIRRDELTGLLRFHAPDFIGTQELLNHPLEYLLSRLPDYEVVGVTRIDGKKYEEYACILYNASLFRVVEKSSDHLPVIADLFIQKN